MITRHATFFTAALLLLAVPAFPGTMFVSDTVLEADVNEQVHPEEVIAGVLVPIPLEGAEICLHYVNTIRKSNRGKIRSEVKILREDGEVETMKFNGRVRSNEMLLCKDAPVLEASDVVAFEIHFVDMPRLRIRKSASESMLVRGLVKAGVTYPPPEPETEPEPEPQSCPPTDTGGGSTGGGDGSDNGDGGGGGGDTGGGDTGGGDGGGGDGGGGDTGGGDGGGDGGGGDDSAPPPAQGGLSSSDFVAAAKLLTANKPVQLWRARSSWGRGKWWVIGPRTVVDRTQVGNVTPSTTGFGNTIAAAVRDYEKKRGALEEGGSLTAAERSLLVWYSKIDSSRGPTSVRRNRSGQYFGEYYRPGPGTQHKGPLPTLRSALEWLKKQGL